jgi:hypothetical protein
MKKIFLMICLIALINALSANGFPGTINKGQIAEVKQNCHHVVIQKEDSKDYFVGKVTEGKFPRPGDEIEGKFNSGHNLLDNLNKHERFQFYTKGSFVNLSLAHNKLKEFCD